MRISILSEKNRHYFFVAIFSFIAVISALPATAQVNVLTQGFEALPFPPTGWSNVRITGPSLPGNWARYGNGLYPVQTPHSGAWQIRFNSHNFGAGTSGEIRTAVMNFTTAGIYTVSFWMYRDNWVANDKLEVFVNTSQTSVGGTLLGTINRDRAQSPVVATNGWYQYTFTIPTTFNTATNYCIFKATSAFGNDIYVDDISVDRLPPASPGCITTYSPANGTTGACINQSMTWDIVSLAAGYKITVGSNSPDYNNVASNVDLGVALSYANTLSASTTYNWKVTPYNGYGDATGCPFRNFTTGTASCYCTPVILEGSCGSGDFIDNFSTTGGTTNITNNASGCSANPNNYTYYSTKTVTATWGNTFNVSMQCGPDFAEGFGIYADWNIDGDFDDAGEYVYNSAFASNSTFNGTITVPYSATPGTTRLRVRCAYNYVPTAGQACMTFNEGEVEDYNIVVNSCATTTYYADLDGDTYGNAGSSTVSCTGAPVGYVANSTDCNDANAAIKPGATEVCNGIDDNCNALTDDGLTFTTYYADADADGFGNSAVTTSTCSGAPVGYVANSTDCNDANAAIKPGAAEVCNGIDDNCSGAADEGLTFTNYYTDADGDGFGANGAPPVSSCAPVPGAVTNHNDCDDTNNAINPSAIEVCNALDDNCDGGVDNGLTFLTYYKDFDADAYGTSAITSTSCAGAPVGYVANNTDCNDNNATIHPGAVELCNTLDDNCNAVIDDGAATAVITPAGPTTVCKGTAVVLNANTGTGYTYQWTKNGSNIGGATGVSYSPTVTGNYQVKVTVPGGCLATSTITAVTINAAPKATITTPDGTDLCGLVNVRLKANSGTGYTYQWYKGAAAIAGATSITYYVTLAAGYKVKVTNTFGCFKNSAVTTIVKTCREGADPATAELSVFPNPAQSSVHISMVLNDDFNCDADIALFDITGNKVMATNSMISNGLYDQTLDISSLASGVYTIRLNALGNVYSKQLVITK